MLTVVEFLISLDRLRYLLAFVQKVIGVILQIIMEQLHFLTHVIKALFTLLDEFGQICDLLRVSDEAVAESRIFLATRRFLRIKEEMD